MTPVSKEKMLAYFEHMDGWTPESNIKGKMVEAIRALIENSDKREAEPWVQNEMDVVFDALNHEETVAKKENEMEFKPDINRVIIELCDRALTARQVRDYMRELDEKQAYSDWTQKWMVLTEVLSMLTGRDIMECLTVTDLENIKKECQ